MTNNTRSREPFPESFKGKNRRKSGNYRLKQAAALLLLFLMSLSMGAGSALGHGGRMADGLFAADLWRVKAVSITSQTDSQPVGQPADGADGGTTADKQIGDDQPDGAQTDDAQADGAQSGGQSGGARSGGAVPDGADGDAGTGQNAAPSGDNVVAGAVSKEIFFVIDGQQIDLEDPIRNIGGRAYYPFRACLEAMGAEVRWDGANQTATGVLGTHEVIFAVDSRTFSVNGLASEMSDAKVFLDPELNRIYIPIRYAAEALGFTVTWHQGSLYDLVELTSPDDLAVVTGANALSLSGKEIYLGQSLAELTSLLGQPERIDPSAYGLRWYVYNRNYENFVMVGIHNNAVTGFFCNSKNLLLKDGLGYGSARKEIEKAYTGVETMEFWYDQHNGDKLYAVWCMNYFMTDAEAQLLFDQNAERLLRAYEQECLDITNAFRVAHGKPAVLYDAKTAEVALAYAKDLAERNFFDHKDPDGQGPMERMVNAGVDVRKVTENLARGYADAIQVFKAWVDSESHRQGMLEDNVNLGVGAYYKSASRGKYYFVQEFTTPW